MKLKVNSNEILSNKKSGSRWTKMKFEANKNEFKGE